MSSCRPWVVAALALGVAGACAVASPTLARTAHHTASASTGSAPSPGDASSGDAGSGDADLPGLPALDPASDAAPGDPPVLAGVDLPPDPGPPASGLPASFASWVAASNDNAGRPFMIVDKDAAKVFAFDAAGDLLGQAPVLIGIARGDNSAPGVGDMALGAIPMDERTTPAGRFMSRFGPSEGEGGTVFWIDYDNAISMHAVINTNPAERRPQRIRSAAPGEHRISHGCINVPAKFYADVVQAAFADGGVVYVLPDTKTLADVFPAFASASADASGVDADATARAPQTRCDDPLLEGLPGVPDPDPALMCPARDQSADDRTAAR